jgi:hypothetical protein
MMLGIYYLDYCERLWPKRGRQMIICYTRTDVLSKMIEKNIPEEWTCWLSECRTPGYLIVGKTGIVRDWIELHMPEEFGKPLRNI